MAGPDPVPEMLRGVWQRSLPVIRERLDQLDATAVAALAGTLTDAGRELSLSNAHKLAGSLGMFGYPAGSELARAIETKLEAETGVDGAALREDAVRLRSLLGL